MTTILPDLAPADQVSTDDRRWWAMESGAFDADESTPLDVLDDAAPFDFDAPVPAFSDDAIEAMYAASAEPLACGTYGHPAWEL